MFPIRTSACPSSVFLQLFSTSGALSFRQEDWGRRMKVDRDSLRLVEQSLTRCMKSTTPRGCSSTSRHMPRMHHLSRLHKPTDSHGLCTRCARQDTMEAPPCKSPRVLHPTAVWTECWCGVYGPLSRLVLRMLLLLLVATDTATIVHKKSTPAEARTGCGTTAPPLC